MNKSKIIIFPLLRDVKTIPPTITILNYLAKKGFKIILYTYYTDVKFNHENINVLKTSLTPYPKSFLKRIVAKTKFLISFYLFFLKKRSEIEAIWLGAWDIFAIDKIKNNIKLIYQFHELEPNKYKYCRKADFVVIPEENRAWITYFEANLQKFPLILPNIPDYNEHTIKPDLEIEELRKNGKIITLYSGLIDIKKRNLKELVKAFGFLPKEYILVILPSFLKIRNDLEILKNYINELNLSERILFLQSRTPPNHLNTMSSVDIGIGFYSPTSLNNVYAAPNRLYEFLCFGTPVILPNYPSFKCLSKEFPYAVNTAEPSNPKSIAKKIMDVKTNYKLAQKSMIEFNKKNGNYNKYAEKIIIDIFES